MVGKDNRKGGELIFSNEKSPTIVGLFLMVFSFAN
jgi:hypothetical protein